MYSKLLEIVKAGDIAAVQEMLAAGTDVDARDTEVGTPLMLAGHTGNLPLVRI